jgi:hypothetical protein
VLLLSSFSNIKYERMVEYENTSDNIPRIKTLVTNYRDGVIESKCYSYNSQKRLEKFIDGEFAEVSYDYILDKDGALTISKRKTYDGEVCFTSETLNRVGQTIKYIDGENKLQLKYNQFNKVSEEIVGDFNVRYSYTDQGKIAQATYSNGNMFKYEYYPNGNKKRVISDAEVINYTPSGEKINIEFANAKSKKTGTLVSGEKGDAALSQTGIYVLYDINSEVGVTNYHTYYGLLQNGFNCYTHAIARRYEIKHPGYYSGREPVLNLLGIKYNVEKDQENLGRQIYDCFVNDSIPSHGWKIALRVKQGYDYHFMIKSSTSTPWRFKAGQSGPVMQLLEGKNPEGVSWDQYIPDIWTNKMIVDPNGGKGFYNGNRKYMIIKE